MKDLQHFSFREVCRLLEEWATGTKSSLIHRAIKLKYAEEYLTT